MFLLIGAFARLAGVSAKQLRAYDALALFRPVWIDPENGYRYYSPAQLLGAAAHPGPATAGHAARRDRSTGRRRRPARGARTASDRARARASGGRGAAPGPRHHRRGRRRPRRRRPTGRRRARGRHAGRRRRRRGLLRAGGARARPRPAGASATRCHAGRAARSSSRSPGPLPETDRIGYRRLPACRVASVIHPGPYGGVAAARDALRQWVTASGLAVEGPMRVLYLPFGAEPELRVPPGWVVHRDEDLVTELQLPVAEPRRPPSARGRRRGPMPRRR